MSQEFVDFLKMLVKHVDIIIDNLVDDRQKSALVNLGSLKQCIFDNLIDIQKNITQDSESENEEECFDQEFDEFIQNIKNIKNSLDNFQKQNSQKEKDLIYEKNLRDIYEEIIKTIKEKNGCSNQKN